MKVLLLVLALSGTMGCAFGTRKVNLVYGDRVTTQVAGPATLRQVAVAKFSDGRPSDATGQLLGRVRNTYGIPTASVVAMQDPVLWVSDGIARALQSRGYRVARVDGSAPSHSLPTVSGTVTRVYSGMYARIQADIEATVTIDQGTTHLFSTACKGSITALAGSVSATEYENVFSAAMDQFIADCVPRLVEPLEDAPTL